MGHYADQILFLRNGVDNTAYPPVGKKCSICQRQLFESSSSALESAFNHLQIGGTTQTQSKDNTVVRIKSCSHLFHIGCLRSALPQKNTQIDWATCPCCQQCLYPGKAEHCWRLYLEICSQIVEAASLEKISGDFQMSAKSCMDLLVQWRCGFKSPDAIMPSIKSRFGVTDQNPVDIWWGQTVSELQDRMDRAEPGHMTFQWFHQRTSEARDEIDANIKMRVTEVNKNVEQLAVGSSNVIKLASLEHLQGRAPQTFEPFCQIMRDEIHATLQRDSKSGSRGKENMTYEDIYESMRQIAFNMSVLDGDEGLR